jgi:gamma-glutamyltranspeptidase/glutathione hydrolase
MRSFHLPGRSPVYGQRAMCATSHPLASLTAIEVLKQGGNGVDAAIAAAALLAVVEPHMTGIGGDCFAILAKPGQKLIALNASGCAPKAATVDWYAEQGIVQIEQQSAHAVTIPGAVDGWATLLADYGTMSLDQVLSPAIDYAEKGFPVAPRVAYDWARVEDKLAANEGARRHLLPGGQAPRVGEVVRFAALGRTLRRIADEGRDGFYCGEVAADMVADLNALGGLHTLEDFAAQKCSYVEPISASYDSIELFELPPNSQGVVALILLKTLRALGSLSDSPTAPERYHAMMEAARLAYAMRDAFIADPEMADVSVGQMLSEAAIDDLARRIDRAKRTPNLGSLPRPAAGDTIYLSVVDENGMAVSFINSLFAPFGSGITSRETGVVLHNRGQAFILNPRHPNCIAPRKRPMHTLAPAMAMRDGRPYLSFGVMGAAFQPIGHVYVVSNMLDCGLDPQEALDAPRVFFDGDELLIEEGVPAATAERLEVMGHVIKVREEPWGGGQIVCLDPVRGVLIGASDARKDGCALGY